MYEEVRQHLKEMLEAGAIRKSQSPYCSNVVLCRKSDGSLRFCIDLRKLNNKTVKDAYSLPRIDDTIDSLIGSKYFSKLDLRSGISGISGKWKLKNKTSIKPRFQSAIWGSTNAIGWRSALQTRLRHSSV